MSQHDDDGQNAEILKKITEKIESIEQTKKSQSSFRNISLIVIIVLIAVLISRLNGIANDLKNNQDQIVQTIQKDGEELLKSRLNDLKAKAQKQLLPNLSKSIKVEYDKNAPKIEKHITDLEQDIRKVTEARIQKLLENALDVAFDNLGDSYSPDEIKELEQNITLLADKVTQRVMEGSAEKIIELEPKFDAIADRLTSISVDVVNIEKIDHDLAERKLVAALLDLLKYKIVPEDGVQPAMQ